MNDGSAVANLAGVDVVEFDDVVYRVDESVAPDRLNSLDAFVATLADIDPDPDQARDEGADDELKASIAGNGVQQPVLLRPHPTALGRYMLVDGERRYRGALAAGLTRIPARVEEAELSVGDRLLKQNLLNDGKRLKPMEEARSWTRIMQDKGWNLQQLANALGRAKSTVSDRLALLDAPAPFQKLFKDGTLTPAAAPIVREYRDVPEKVLKAAIAQLQEGYWYEAVEAGVPVSVDNVRRGLEDELTSGWSSHLRAIRKDLVEKYDGPVATIKGQKYALDVPAYQKLEDAVAPKHDGDAKAKREQAKWEVEAAERRSKERKAHEKKRALRVAQWNAISAKLPTSLDGPWALFLIRQLTRGIQQDYLRVACKALAIDPPKKGTYGGFQFDKALVAHAEKLTAGGRVQLALGLLCMHDLQVSPYDMGGPERFAAAAKLLKIDLAKVKAPVSEKAPKSAANTKAKKGKR